MRYENWANAAIIVVGLMLAGYCIGRAQTRPNVKVLQASPAQQVVFEFRGVTDVDTFLVTSKSPVMLVLFPLKPLRPAPKAPGTLMLCRMSVEMIGSVKIGDNPQEPTAAHVARCGSESYIIGGLDFGGEKMGDVEGRRNLGIPAGQLQ